MKHLNTLLRLTLPTVSAALALALAPGAVSASDLSSEPTLRPASAGPFVGLVRDQLVASGADYEARFAAGQATFVPALGRQAPELYPLTLQLESIARGADAFLVADGSALPQIGRDSVFFTHPTGIVETYHARRDGVEQTFTFPTQPAGSGDLIVRVQLETDLRIQVPDADSIGFRMSAVSDDGKAFGGVRFGGVTGVDARGTQVRGSVQVMDDGLELRLPAAFVESAAYPLVLDPTISTEIGLSGAVGARDSHIEAAYMASAGLYLVAWERAFSFTDTEILFTRIASNGTVLDPATPLEPLGSFGNPTVGALESTGEFLIAYESAPSPLGPWEIHTNGVTGATGAITGWIDVGAGTNPSAGGTRSGNHTLLAWEDEDGGINGQLMELLPNHNPVGLFPFTISADDRDGKPCVSNTSGDDEVWLVVWEREETPFLADMHHDIYGRVIGLNGVAQTPISLVDGGTGTSDEQNPDCDTRGGLEFAVVFETQAMDGDGDNDVMCRKLSYDLAGSLIVEPAIEISALEDVDESTPAIAFAGEKYIAVWSREVADLNYDIRAVSIRADDCTLCEAEYAVAATGRAELEPDICSRTNANGGANDRALVVWQSADFLPPFDSDVHARRVESLGPGGGTTLLGGSCGNSGSIDALGPAAFGNSNFEVALSGAPLDSLIAVLALRLDDTFLDCGPCTWLVWDASPSLLFFEVPVAGTASVNVPLPCNPAFAGVEVNSQWLVQDVGGSSPCSLFPGFALTDILEFTLGN